MSEGVERDESHHGMVVASELYDNTDAKVENLENLKLKASEILSNAYNVLVQESSRLLQNSNKNGHMHLDEGELRNRLITYSLDKWRGMPKELNVRILGCHGWICIEIDTLQCVACRKYLNVNLPSPRSMSYHTYFQAINRIKDAIVEDHETHCRFRHPVIDYDSCFPLEDLREANLILNFVELSSLNWCEMTIYSSLSTDSLLEGLDFDSTRVKSALLATSGWKKSHRTDDAILCTYCHKTIGLWLFRNKRTFHVEEQHYDWCSYAFNVDFSISRHPRLTSIKKLSCVDNKEALGFLSCVDECSYTSCVRINDILPTPPKYNRVAQNEPLTDVNVDTQVVTEVVNIR